MLLMAGTLPSGPSVAPPAPKPADLPACRDDERGLLVRHKVAWTLSPPKGVAGPKISVDSGGVFLTSERLYLSARSKKDTSGAIYEVSLRSILGERSVRHVWPGRLPLQHTCSPPLLVSRLLLTQVQPAVLRE